jgi:hypothetical protein
MYDVSGWCTKYRGQTMIRTISFMNMSGAWFVSQFCLPMLHQQHTVCSNEVLEDKLHGSWCSMNYNASNGISGSLRMINWKYEAEMARFRMLSWFSVGKDWGKRRKIAIRIVVEPAETRIGNHPDVKLVCVEAVKRPWPAWSCCPVFHDEIGITTKYVRKSTVYTYS